MLAVSLVCPFDEASAICRVQLQAYISSLWMSRHVHAGRQAHSMVAKCRQRPAKSYASCSFEKGNRGLTCLMVLVMHICNERALCASLQVWFEPSNLALPLGADNSCGCCTMSQQLVCSVEQLSASGVHTISSFVQHAAHGRTSVRPSTRVFNN